MNPINQPRLVNIEEMIQETPTTRTLKFQDELCSRAEPGQFLMVWIHGVDEKPMSISIADSTGFTGITVRAIGRSSSALCNMKPGDSISVRGPYGNSFIPPTGKTLLVGGGTGLAPLVLFAEKLLPLRKQFTFIAAAASEAQIPFKDRLRKLELSEYIQLVWVTEDGSCGLKSTGGEIAGRLMKQTRYQRVYTCGPEKMMRRIFDRGEETETIVEASLERVMKCAVGLCGSCTLGRHILCTEGPILDSVKLREITQEFGLYRRDASGRRIPL